MSELSSEGITQIAWVTGDGKIPGVGPQAFGPPEFTDYNPWAETL